MVFCVRREQCSTDQDVWSGGSGREWGGSTCGWSGVRGGEEEREVDGTAADEAEAGKGKMSRLELRRNLCPAPVSVSFCLCFGVFVDLLFPLLLLLLFSSFRFIYEFY
ncbi:hypothetical protein E2C01_081338 [Portunus trituberculatus]|uniref:Uncharacterized protein n=1 Tax=Portunus trituberculatus TaxID=210409 RepID=A0A5B7J0V4_PORTR|nr:hypothetical protein [Portunus trituberculatus]